MVAITLTAANDGNEPPLSGAISKNVGNMRRISSVTTTTSNPEEQDDAGEHTATQPDDPRCAPCLRSFRALGGCEELLDGKQPGDGKALNKDCVSVVQHCGGGLDAFCRRAAEETYVDDEMHKQAKKAKQRAIDKGEKARAEQFAERQKELANNVSPHDHDHDDDGDDAAPVIGPLRSKSPHELLEDHAVPHIRKAVFPIDPSHPADGDAGEEHGLPELRGKGDGHTDDSSGGDDHIPDEFVAGVTHATPGAAGGSDAGWEDSDGCLGCYVGGKCFDANQAACEAKGGSWREGVAAPAAPVAPPHPPSSEEVKQATAEDTAHKHEDEPLSPSQYDMQPRGKDPVMGQPEAKAVGTVVAHDEDVHDNGEVHTTPAEVENAEHQVDASASSGGGVDAAVGEGQACKVRLAQAGESIRSPEKGLRGPPSPPPPLQCIFNPNPIFHSLSAIFV